MKQENKQKNLIDALDKVDDALGDTLCTIVHFTDAIEQPQNMWLAYGVKKSAYEYKQDIKKQIESAQNALRALWDEVESI